MASREFESFMELMQGSLACPEDSLEDARQKLEAIHGHPIADDTSVEWTKLGGVRCAWVASRSFASSSRILLLCHGGAYVAACGDGYLFYAEMLSRFCEARILLVDYRLAPEHHHPAALEDCAAAYEGLLGTGYSPDQIGLIGDSCGGALAVACLLLLRDRGVCMPACALTLGGWFDLEASGESATHPVGREPFAHPEFTRARGRDYVGPDGDLRDPLVSPIHADLYGLPPLLLQVGQVDLTRDDAIRLAAKAGRAGVRIQLEIHPEMIHGFQGLAQAGIPEAVAAMKSAGSFAQAEIPAN